MSLTEAGASVAVVVIESFERKSERDIMKRHGCRLAPLVSPTENGYNENDNKYSSTSLSAYVLLLRVVT